MPPILPSPPPRFRHPRDVLLVHALSVADVEHIDYQLFLLKSVDDSIRPNTERVLSLILTLELLSKVGIHEKHIHCLMNASLMFLWQALQGFSCRSVNDEGEHHRASSRLTCSHGIHFAGLFMSASARRKRLTSFGSDMISSVSIHPSNSSNDIITSFGMP